MDEVAFRTGCNDLANAIEAGCKLTEKVRFLLFKFDKNDPYRVVGACVLGSAVIGKKRTVFPEDYTGEQLQELFPILGEYIQLPIYLEYLNGPRKLIDVIAILNDCDKKYLSCKAWTREEIAAWVRTIARAEEV